MLRNITKGRWASATAALLALGMSTAADLFGHPAAIGYAARLTVGKRVKKGSAARDKRAALKARNRRKHKAHA